MVSMFPRSARIDQQASYSITCTAMAGSIAYSSFPRLARKRRYPFPNVPTMCLQIMKTLAALSGFKGCFSRSDKSLVLTHDNSSSSSQEGLRSGPGRVRRSNATISSRHYVIAAGHTSACVCHACLSQVRTTGPSNTKDQWSSGSTSPRSSIRSVSGKLRIRLKRSWSSWRSEHSDSDRRRRYIDQWSQTRRRFHRRAGCPLALRA
jgi:hypothetical protein